MSEYKNTSAQIRLPIIVAIALILGVILGKNFAEPNVDKEFLSSYQKLQQLIEFIENDYVDSVNTESLIEESIENMLDKLDLIEHIFNRLFNEGFCVYTIYIVIFYELNKLL